MMNALMTLKVADYQSEATSPAPSEATGHQPVYSPESSPAEIVVSILVFVLAFIYLCLFRRFTTMEPDEGIILQGAARILHGQVIYRDFFSFLTPGSYYLNALLFEVFGNSIVVARTALAFGGGILSTLTYLLARRVCRRWVSMIAAAMVTLTALPFRFLVLHNWDSTLWASLAVYGAIRYLETAQWKWALALGSFTALTILFEQSKGAGLLLGLAAGFAVIVAAGKRYGLLLGWKRWLALCVGFAWPFLLVLGYFGARHALIPFAADTIWPIRNYSRANAVPYGYQNWSNHTRSLFFGAYPWAYKLLVALVVSPGFLLPVLPIIAAGVLGCLAVRSLRTREAEGRSAYYVLVTACLSGLGLSVLASRADVLHFVYLSPLSYLLLAWYMDGRDIHGKIICRLRPLVTTAVLVSATALGIAFLHRDLNARERFQTRRGTISVSAPDRVLEYTQAHVPAGSKILVYPYLPLYYFLTGTFSPTQFEYLQPGMHTREQDQDAIRVIEADHTPVVLFEPGFNEKIGTAWPNTPLPDVANDPVAAYIQGHYHPCQVLRSGAGWPFVYMVPKGKVCPAPQPAREPNEMALR